MKRLLFVGIVLLVVGIILKKLTHFDVLGLSLIISGAILKAIYIISKIKNGEYHPGRELAFLGIGLILFFTGLYLKKINQPSIYPNFFIFSGLTLKVIFILLFIKIVRSLKK